MFFLHQNGLSRALPGVVALCTGECFCRANGRILMRRSSQVRQTMPSKQDCGHLRPALLYAVSDQTQRENFCEVAWLCLTGVLPDLVFSSDAKQHAHLFPLSFLFFLPPPQINNTLACLRGLRF